MAVAVIRTRYMELMMFEPTARMIGAALVVLALSWTVTPVSAQTQADSTAIHEVVLDYVDGWWTGDAERMESALHPDLVKRIVFTHEATGRSMMNSSTNYEMVEYTRAGGGSAEPEQKGEVEIRILALHGEIANVLATSARYVDYLHLAKWDGKWVIMNVLWGAR